jgi:hypothetical protein
MGREVATALELTVVSTIEKIPRHRQVQDSKHRYGDEAAHLCAAGGHLDDVKDVGLEALLICRVREMWRAELGEIKDVLQVN